MSRLPNPFLSGQGNQQRTPQRPSTPGFLMMTRPPVGNNSFGGPQYQSPATPSENFIPFSNIGSNSNSNDNRHGNSQGHGRFNFNRNSGGGRHNNNNNSRFAHPYQQSPAGRMPSPRSHHGHGHSHGYGNTPGGRYNPNSSGMSYSTPRGNFNVTPGGRFSHGGGGGRRDNFRDRQNRSYNDFNTPDSNGNNKGGWDRSRGRGPISSIPIDKFINDNMVEDPWVEFYDGLHSDNVEHLKQSDSGCLEDSEIIIDSDTSARVENSFDDVVSDTEVDSSPIHDTGSDSPNIATSSTSEKDTGSDSGSDT
ncbi:caprin homolog [Palaemon carinicauda]|uniref:caprin homolog n=1 Tax=Palaemon carinicauda TaxID=392227 RepID=UPI0035B678A7